MDTSLAYFFTSPKTISKCRRGPIAGYLEQYAQHLKEQGYARQTGRHHLAVLGAFNEWLDKRKLDATAVTVATAHRYLQWRWRRCRRRDYEAAILERLLELVHPAMAKAPQPATPNAAEQAVADYRRWLEQERGLAQVTVVTYLAFARKFLTIQFPQGEVDFRQLTPDRITDYIRQQAQQMEGSLRIPLLVTALRSFLRHLLQSDLIQTDLAVCVPAVATWSLSDVPKYLSPDQVQKVIDGCDRNRAGGKRNYAILLLLARLGLRASEVVALTLDDLDWEAGLITIHGKGKGRSTAPAHRGGRSHRRVCAVGSAGVWNMPPGVHPQPSALGWLGELRSDLLSGGPGPSSGRGGIHPPWLACVSSQFGHPDDQ